MRALVPPAAQLGGVLAAVVTLARVVHSVATRGSSGLFNDFYDYWAAGVLLNRGQDPYDVAALHAVQRAAGLHTETGGGYSYPLLFAHVLRPLALIAAPQAGFIFMGLSVIALCGAIALLLGSIPDLRWPVGLVGGILAGLFPPVIGSLYFGQANLLVLLALALAYRRLLPHAMLSVATLVKLYPATGFLAILFYARRRRWALGLLGLGLVLILLTNQLGVAGMATRTGSFIGPDTYWSNESINGWLSRLAIASTWTRPPFPGLPVEPLMLVAVAILASLTVAVLLLAGQRPWEGALALSLWLGVVAAPKNSLWNFTPLLLCVVFIWTTLRGRWWIGALGAVGWLLIELQAQLDSARETVYQASPQLAWLSSVGLYGALIIGGITAYVLLRPVRPFPPPSLPRPSR